MTEQSTIAFHGDEKLGRDILAEVIKHEADDRIVQGMYHNKNASEFRGCFIGCATHSYEIARGADVSIEYDSLEDIERAYNFDPRLTAICERIFEDSEIGYAKTFLRRVTEAALTGAKRGVNIRLVHWQFLHWMVQDTLAQHGTPAIRYACKDAVAVLQDLARGVKVTDRRASRAAITAARAARAGRAVAAVAAVAARATTAAACATTDGAACATTDATACTADAYTTHTELGDKLIQFIAGEVK